MSLLDQEHIFEPFWQADPRSTNSSGSTGLGLPVARQLARLLGGDLFLTRSVIGEGSTFVVSLPARYPGDGARAGPVAVAAHG
jgi:signal transduction histidine kinase